MIHELVKYSPKKHSPVLLSVVQINDLIIFHDKICWKFYEEIILVITERNKKIPRDSPI